MILYIIILSLIFWFGFFDILSDNIKQKKFFLIIIFILFVFQDGLRWETGTDWLPYYGFFHKIPEYSWLPYEPGFVLLNKIIRSLFNNYTAFLLIHAFIVYALYISSIYKITRFPIISLLVFYSLVIGYMGMNRQHIALAISLFSILFILKKEKYKFLFTILIASLFHFSALFFLICYPLNRRIRGEIILICLVISIIIGQIDLHLIIRPLIKTLQIPPVFAWKLLFYTKGIEFNSILWLIAGSLKRLIIFSFIYFNRDKIKQYFPPIDFFLNVYFFSILLYFSFNNSIQVIVSRGMLYFGIIPEMILLSSVLFLFKKNLNRIIAYFIIFLFVLFTFSKSISVFYDLFVPYKGIFINTGFLREMY